ncbi:murein biosynthesis integral membrane protein MurJ [Planococcus sp. 1R117A]|uniref:murein biosynthesis integral membrane protein MurJ n=1 Tax=Planococcus sp. 1R117A TaxID=3447020 RepID=UPI003EDBE430
MEKTVIALMTVIIVTKVLGFSRDISLSYFYGADGLTDAYLVSTDIPTAFFSFIGMGIVASFIPIFTKIQEKQGIAEARKFTANVINIVLLLSTGIVVLILLFPQAIVKVFASGFEGETLKIAIDFTRIAALSIYFTALIYVFNGYLEVHKSFLPTVLAGLPLNIMMLFVIYLSSFTNIYVLSIGTLVAVVVQFLFLVPWIRKTGYRHSFKVNPREKNVKKMMYIAIPVIIGVSADQINVLVDRTLASQIVEGGISALTYSHRIIFFIQAIFVTAVVTVMFPKISKLAVKQNMAELKNIVGKIITTVALIVIPAAVGIMIFSTQITELLFGRGAFEANEVILTSGVLFFYAVGMLGFGLREVLVKVFYSLEDSRTPMISAFGAMFLNVILCLILSRFMGINGLALATSISTLVFTGFLYISLVRKVGSMNSLKIVQDLFKAVMASAVMGFSAKYIYTLLDEAGMGILALAGGIGAGIVVYASMLWVLQLSDIGYYKSRIVALAKR